MYNSKFNKEVIKEFAIKIQHLKITDNETGKIVSMPQRFGVDNVEDNIFDFLIFCVSITKDLLEDGVNPRHDITYKPDVEINNKDIVINELISLGEKVIDDKYSSISGMNEINGILNDRKD